VQSQRRQRGVETRQGEGEAYPVSEEASFRIFRDVTCSRGS